MYIEQLFQVPNSHWSQKFYSCVMGNILSIASMGIHALSCDPDRSMQFEMQVLL